MILAVRNRNPEPQFKYAATVINEEDGTGVDIALFKDLEVATTFAVWYSTVHPPERRQKHEESSS